MLLSFELMSIVTYSLLSLWFIFGSLISLGINFCFLVISNLKGGLSVLI